MEKNYIAELDEWIKRRKGSKPIKGEKFVEFLAVRKDVETAVGAGYMIKIIWEHLHEAGKVSCHYETFLRYTKKHITRVHTNKKDRQEQKAMNRDKKDQKGHLDSNKNDQKASAHSGVFDKIPIEDLI